MATPRSRGGHASLRALEWGPSSTIHTSMYRHQIISDPAARARAPPPAPPRLPEDVRRSSFARPGGLSLRPPSQGRRARPAVGASPPPPSPLAPRRRLRPSPSSAPLGNEHWKDLVVTVRDDVLIPRPETEAVVDMVATTDYERGSWSCPSSSSAAALRFGSIAVPCVDVSISFTDRRLHEVGRRGLEFMPFLLSLSVFLFGTSWFIYALLGLDPFIFDLILVLLLHLAELPLGPQKEFYLKKFGENLKPQRQLGNQESTWGRSMGSTTHQGTPRSPGTPWFAMV
ncbi:Bidirectional sugar transporter SWEET1a [Triticum urartu]|uniref:Bidirectional sugar transporter SWEET1a n=1 Tax=Triticum urartu TaxID=4572 RepID=M8A159_TRIUA|nr:Bidirectional sugar transporter SWEET1a [Triticum urartu]